MHIDSLALNAFKGVTASEKLGQLNLLLGPNGSGKTARLLATRFAITGVTPAGSKNDAALLYAANGRCSVSVTLNDGRLIERHVRSNGTTVSQDLFVAGVNEKGTRRVQERLGEIVGDFAPMWDVAAFTSLSLEKQRAAVVELCAKASGDFDVHEFVQAINNHIDSAHASPAETLALNSYLAQLPAVVSHCSDRASAADVAISWSRSKANQAKQQADAAHQAARHLSEGPADAPPIGGSVEQLQEDLQKARHQDAELVGQIANQEGRATARTSLADQMDMLAEQVAAGEKQYRELMSLDVEYTGHMAHALAVEQQAADLRETLPEVDSERIARLRQDAINAEKRRDDATEAASAAANEHEKLAGQSREILVRIAALEQAPWTRALQSWQRIKVGLQDQPANSDVAQAVAELDLVLGEQADPSRIERLREQHGAVQIQIKAAMNVAQVALGDKDAARQDCTAAVEAWHDAEGEAGKVLAEQSRVQNEIRDLGQEGGQLRSQCQRRAEQLAQLADQIDRRKKARADAESRLNALDSEGGLVPTETLEQQREALRERIGQLEASISAATRTAEASKMLHNASADAEGATASVEMGKAVELAAKACREALMHSLVAPLINNMASILKAAMPGCAAYCALANERGTAIFELGWVCDGQRVSLAGLSGGESTIFLAALAYSLVKLADPPLKLLLIEAAELDKDHMDRLAGALRHVEGEMQVLVAACHTEPQVVSIEGWNVMALSRRTAITA